jgi:uncharacterized protein YoxC
VDLGYIIHDRPPLRTIINKNVKRKMTKISKRAIPLIIILIMTLSVLSVPVLAAVSVDSADGGDGEFGDTIVVLGGGVTAGVDVNLYWDAVKAWDGEKGMLNSTEAEASGAYEIWFDVPEGVNGSHYLWAKDTDTGDTANLHFWVVPSVQPDPDSGLVDDKITIEAYGFGDENEITSITISNSTYNAALSTTPSTPECSELGSWTATFKVPQLAYGDYVLTATDEDGYVGVGDFTIGASIEIDVEEGDVGTVIRVDGRGYTDGVNMSSSPRSAYLKGNSLVNITWDGTGTVESVECYVTDYDVVDDGEFEIEIVVPQVDKTGDYIINVTDGTYWADEEFEVLGLAEIELEPEYGVQGASIQIRGYNFTQISDEEVVLELWDESFTTMIKDIEDFETNADGEFSGSFTVPARSSGVYQLNAVQDNFLINGSSSFRIGMIIVILSPSSGPSGTEVTMTGTGFTENGEWNATFGDDDLIEDGDVDADGNLELDLLVPTFFVPSEPVGTYELTITDVDAEISVDVEFDLTATTTLELDPTNAPYEYNVTIIGQNFSEDEGADLDWVLWNETDDWDMDVYTYNDVENAKKRTDLSEDGNFTGWWIAEGSELSKGDYWINCTDDNDLFAQILFSVVAKTVDIEPRKASFALGDTVAFNIESSFKQIDAYIDIMNPAGELYWETDLFDDDLWIKVGVLQRLPYYEQTAGGNPMILSDAPLGTWSWTMYDEDDDELDSGTFTVTAAPSDVLAEQLSGLSGDLDTLSTDFSSLSADVGSLASDVAGLADSVATAASAAQAAASAVDDLTDTVADIASVAADAAQAAEDAATAATGAKEAADAADKAAGGLTTLVYGAIGASLVAALAAIVALMQISRRIAG